MTNQTMEETMLASLDRVMRLLRRRPAGSHHLGRGVFRLLRTIKEQGEAPTRDLAGLLDVRSASLNEKLISLEERGMIRRVRDPKDQRVFLVKLLPQGETYLEDLKKERRALNRSIAHILSPEEAKELIRLTGKLADGLEQMMSDPVDPSAQGGR